MKYIVYATAGKAAQEHAARLRAEHIEASAVECYACREAEPDVVLEFLPDVSKHERARINALFGVAEPAPAAKPAQPVTPKPAAPPAA